MLVGPTKRRKKQLPDKLVSLDKKAEQTLLSPQEIDLKNWLNNHLAHLLREEEIKWYQRAKSNIYSKGILIQNMSSFLQIGNIRKHEYINYKIITG
jgi:hypothetical protein